MDIKSHILRLIAHILGTGLHLFLVILLVAKRRATVADRLALVTIIFSGTWHFLVAAVLYQGFAFQEPDPGLVYQLRSTASVALLFVPAFLLHLVMVWAGVPAAWGIVIYAAPAFALWQPGFETTYLGTALLAALAVSVRTAQKQEYPAFRWFHLSIAASLAAIAVAGLSGRESSFFAFASLMPLACLVLTCINLSNVV